MINFRLVPKWVLAGASLALWPSLVAADILFKEDFEGEMYVAGETLPNAYGKIHYGRWAQTPSSQEGKISEDRSSNGARSLLLDKVESGGSVQAVGIFGVTNERPSVVVSALRLKLAFNVTDRLQKLYIIIRGNDSKSRAVVAMNGAGALVAHFGTTSVMLSEGVEPGNWYHVEFLLPATPAEGGDYTVNLYEADGKTLLSSKVGAVAGVSGDNDNTYAYFVVRHDSEEASIYLDEIVAETLPSADSVTP